MAVSRDLEFHFCIGHSLVITVEVFCLFVLVPTPSCPRFTVIFTYLFYALSINDVYPGLPFCSFEAGISSCITHLGNNSGITHDILSITILCSSSLRPFCHVMGNTNSSLTEPSMLLMCNFSS